MKQITGVVLLLLISIFCCCNQKNNETKLQKDNVMSNPKEQKKDSIKENPKEDLCDYEAILNDPKTPKLVKELYHNTVKKLGEPTTYFDYLKSNNPKEKAFYFRIITNSYAFSDGAYSEELGNLGKEYVEYQTKDFASFFDNQNCFTDDDLKTWAKIAVLEFEIIDETIETKKGEPLVNVYSRKLVGHTKGFTENQKKTIQKFTLLLKKEWEEFVKKN